MSLTDDRAGVFQACVVTEEHVGSSRAEGSAASVLQGDTSDRTAPSRLDPSLLNPLSCSVA